MKNAYADFQNVIIKPPEITSIPPMIIGKVGAV